MSLSVHHLTLNEFVFCPNKMASGYVSIPLSIGPNTVHTVFARKHINRNNESNESDSSSDSDSDNEDSSVFVMNLPIDITDDNIKDICEALGNVHFTSFQRLGLRYGLIALLDEKSANRFLEKAKTLATKKHAAIAFEQYGPKGAAGYIARQAAKFPSETDLMKAADEYMELLAQQEEIEAQEAFEASTKVDEDGFQLVVYKNRKRLADIPDAVTETAPKKKKLEKDDFYKFQLRANRKQEMSDLLQRFQEDKAKIEELKKKKRFRPFWGCLISLYLFLFVFMMYSAVFVGTW